jgi:glycosyltransferase involved in cell wall biosynthesis
MHITYLSYSKIPSREANSIQVVKMCAAFARLGHRVTLFAVRGADEKTSIAEFYGITDEFKVVKIGLPKIPGLRQLWYTCAVVFHLINQPRPAIFYGRDALYSLSAAALFGSPVILEVHTPPHHIVERWFTRWLSKRGGFARLVAISKSLITYYKKMLPELDQEKFLVAQDGADPVLLESQPSLPALPSTGREEALQVGYSGHLYAGRGMEVICRLAERIPDMDFHIWGGQQDHIASWEEHYRRSNLYFHGFIPHKEVLATINRCHILLAPYQTKVAAGGNKGDTAAWMSPLKIFEYMSVGKAIVCSDLPALREILTPEVDCLLVEPDNIDAWVGALLRLQNEEYREMLGKAAQERFNQQYTWEKRAELILKDLPASWGEISR